MILKYPNLYFLFFCLACSAAIFPSMLDNYIGYRIPIGYWQLALDELILLLCLFVSALTLMNKYKIPSKIGGNGLYISFFVVLIFLLFLISFFRADASIDVISRDRWILLNLLIVYLPFIYRPNVQDLRTISRHFVQLIAFLMLLKIFSFLVLGPDNRFAYFGPDFTFMLAISVFLLLFSTETPIIKYIYVSVAFFVTLYGEQLSAILFICGCVIVPAFFLSHKNKMLLISLFFLFLGSLFFVDNYFSAILDFLELGSAHFTVMDKLLDYFDLWAAPFSDISLFEFIFGRGAGYVINLEVYRESYESYAIVQHSLAHNIFVTLFVKFGILGLLFFSFIVGPVFLSLSNKFTFKQSLIIKILLALVLANFLSTPGVWKIRKGVFLWFIIGLLYFLRPSSKMISACNRYAKR